MFSMSMKRKRLTITLPGYVDVYLHEMMDKMGSNKSDLIEAMILFVSMPEHEDEFMSQYGEGEDVDDDDGEEDDE